MKLHTLWLVCCFGLLRSGGRVDGFNRDRRSTHREFTKMRPSSQSQVIAPPNMHNYVYVDNWILYTISNYNDRRHSYIRLTPVSLKNIPPYFTLTQCPQWMFGVPICYISYQKFPENPTHNEDVPPEITSSALDLPEELDITTKKSDHTEKTTVSIDTDEDFSIDMRFGKTPPKSPKFDFDVYYNTKTGIDLNVVTPLRTPTIKIPPADHSIIITEKPHSASGSRSIWHTKGLITNNKKKSPSSVRPDKNNRAVQTTTINPNFDKQDQDDGPVIFGDERTEIPRTGTKSDKLTLGSETMPTSLPAIPCTNVKQINSHSTVTTTTPCSHDNSPEESIQFEDKRRNVFEKSYSLEEVTKECCKPVSIENCFESKGFTSKKNSCDSVIQKG